MPFVATAQQDVTFTSSFPDFAIVSTATGKATKTGPFIAVALNRFTMRANILYKILVKVIRCKLGLAFQKNNGEWDIRRWSEPVNTNILMPGDTKFFENVKAVIPIDNLSSLKDYWLVLTVEVDNNGITGYIYSHSKKGLF